LQLPLHFCDHTPLGLRHNKPQPPAQKDACLLLLLLVLLLLLRQQLYLLVCLLLKAHLPDCRVLC
jgi:hypothetical protein